MHNETIVEVGYAAALGKKILLRVVGKPRGHLVRQAYDLFETSFYAWADEVDTTGNPEEFGLEMARQDIEARIIRTAVVSQLNPALALFINTYVWAYARLKTPIEADISAIPSKRGKALDAILVLSEYDEIPPTGVMGAADLGRQMRYLRKGLRQEGLIPTMLGDYL